MTIERIVKKVRQLKRQYNEDNPELLCSAMGILLCRMPMGKNNDACKGFFLRQSRIPLIMLNNDQPARLQRVVLAHELGHANLHAEIKAIHEFQLFDGVQRCEYEANLFAAEYLLTDEAVREALLEDSSLFNAARRLMVPAELLDFKLRILKSRGLPVEAPLYADSCFMRRYSGFVQTK